LIATDSTGLEAAYRDADDGENDAEEEKESEGKANLSDRKGM
jgi:hypothetical protein